LKYDPVVNKSKICI